MKKFLERKFAIPGLAGLLPIANDLAGMKIDFKVLCLVAGVSLVWAMIECAHDIARLKYSKQV